ncbi:MAG: tetratricopeptide repeat protein [Leadbetterella sp.]
MNKFVFFALLCVDYSVFGQQQVNYIQNNYPKRTTNTPVIVNHPNTPVENRGLEKTPKNSTEVIQKVVIVSKTAPMGVDINYIPLFGGYDKTQEQKSQDSLFIVECKTSFSDNKEASEFFSKMAWQYLEEGDKSLATHRFNLAWLLNDLNYDPYWGLGVIEYQRKNVSSAIRLMTKGKELANSNHVIILDLATLYLQQAIANPSLKVELAEAKKLIKEAIEHKPTFSTAHYQLASCYLLENELDAAWEEFHKGYELNPSENSDDLLRKLLVKKPDPKGIFK